MSPLNGSTTLLQFDTYIKVSSSSSSSYGHLKEYFNDAGIKSISLAWRKQLNECHSFSPNRQTPKQFWRCLGIRQSTVSSVSLSHLNASNSWKKIKLVCKSSSTGKFRSPSQKRMIYFDFWEVCIQYSLVKVIFLRFLGIALFTLALYRMHLYCLCRIFSFEFIFETGIHQLGEYYVWIITFDRILQFSWNK